MVLVIQDLSRWLFGAEDILGPLAPGLKGSINIMGALLPEYDIALILLAPLILAGLWLLLNRTRWGILVRAATEDREMTDASDYFALLDEICHEIIDNLIRLWYEFALFHVKYQI